MGILTVDLYHPAGLSIWSADRDKLDEQNHYSRYPRVPKSYGGRKRAHPWDLVAVIPVCELLYARIAQAETVPLSRLNSLRLTKHPSR